MTSLKATLFGTAAVLAALTLSAGANAAVIVKYSLNGGAFNTITDGGVGDTDAGTGSITVNLTGLGSFAITGPSTTGNGNNNGNTTTPPFQLHLTLSGNVKASTAGSIDIYVTSTDFSPAGLPANYNFVSDLGISANPGTLHYQSFLDLENDAFGEGELLGDITRTTAGSAAGYTNTETYTIEDMFSLTERFAWSWGSGAQRGIAAVGTIDVTAVPEPATLALLGAGLLGMGLMRRRKA